MAFGVLGDIPGLVRDLKDEIVKDRCWLLRRA